MRAGGRSAAIALLTAASALLPCACGTPRLARQPEPAADLSGHWVLDPAASDDAAALITAALPTKKPPSPVQAAPTPDPQQRSTRPPGGGQRGRGNNSTTSAAPRAPEPDPAWGRARPGDFVAAFALPPQRLDVVQEPSLVRLATGERVRAFEPGDDEPLSLTDRFGSRHVRAGWTHDELLIASNDGSRLSVVEHYRRRADDRLERRVEFSAQGVKSLKIKTSYRRATAAEIDATPSEGPPAPVR